MSEGRPQVFWSQENAMSNDALRFATQRNHDVYRNSSTANENTSAIAEGHREENATITPRHLMGVGYSIPKYAHITSVNDSIRYTALTIG